MTLNETDRDGGQRCRHSLAQVHAHTNSWELLTVRSEELCRRGGGRVFRSYISCLLKAVRCCRVSPSHCTVCGYSVATSPSRHALNDNHILWPVCTVRALRVHANATTLHTRQTSAILYRTANAHNTYTILHLNAYACLYVLWFPE